MPQNSLSQWQWRPYTREMDKAESTEYRCHNFSAGPAVLPVDVLKTARGELLNYRGSGSSIMELSHRGPEYMEVDAQARSRLSDLLGLGDDFEVMFLQGGASTQFMMAPMNFLPEGRTADYLNTGTWARKAIKEARIIGNVHEAFSSEDTNYSRVPRDGEIRMSDDPAYLHFTSNNTIFGTQHPGEPESGGVPLICDASSDFLSRPLDVKRYGMIYAGAQKNAGPSGVTVVLLRRDFLETARTEGLPSMLRYKTHAGTMFNTPPTFGVYLVNLVLGWLQENGGLAAMERRNREKAQLLYAEIDRDEFYRTPVEDGSRSLMNVVFRLPNEDLEKRFLGEAEARGLMGLKGHRSVGGLRASIYNACPRESVEALAGFMVEFRKTHG